MACRFQECVSPPIFLSFLVEGCVFWVFCGGLGLGDWCHECCRMCNQNYVKNRNIKLNMLVM